MKRHPLIDWSQLGPLERKAVLQRPTSEQSKARQIQVESILHAIKEEGDVALAKFTAQFDHFDIGGDFSRVEVTADEWEKGLSQVTPRVGEAVRKAIHNIEIFHERQLQKPMEIETSPGVICQKQWTPLSCVGLYIPGGTAPLPSTLLMLGIPARIAGCETKIMCSPPNSLGLIHPTLLFAAREVGISRIFKAGGAQAIAAMAYGTSLIPKTDKIFGPGNAWVTEAKIQVSLDPEGADIDMPAGPSEVLVIADESAQPSFVAADLLAQAEHGADSQVILVSNSAELIQKVQAAVEIELKNLSRANICRQSLEHSRWIITPTLDDALAVSEAYAPEHLILQISDPSQLASQVRRAGSVFLGPWTPESLGDYASGTNHVLPTYGYAKSKSGLSVLDFMRSTTFQTATQDGLRLLAPVVEALAHEEGLTAHARAVEIRRKELEAKSGNRS